MPALHAFLADIDPENSGISALVVQYHSGQSIEFFLEAIQHELKAIRLFGDFIVIRPELTDTFYEECLHAKLELEENRVGSKFLEQLSIAMRNLESFRRFESIPLHILNRNKDGIIFLSGNINPLFDFDIFSNQGIDKSVVINEIKKSEMEYISESCQSLMTAPPGSYYFSPSNNAVRSFLRVGNIQYSLQAIDAVCFWISEFCIDIHGIIVDTWSISSIAFRISNMIAHDHCSNPIPVEILTEYQDASPEKSAVSQIILNRLSSRVVTSEQNETNVLCLLSATHTGSLEDVISNLVLSSGLKLNVSYLSLFKLGEASKITTLYDWSGSLEFTPLSADEISGSEGVPIDKAVYFPLSYQDVNVQIRNEHAEAIRPFIDRFQGKRILSVHRDQKADGLDRHHAVHIDTQLLFREKEFRSDLEALLSALPSYPDIIISPPHAAAVDLANYAVEYFSRNGLTPLLFHHSHLAFATDGAMAEIERAIGAALEVARPESSLLIMDDAFITGARLAGYQTRLRAIGFEGRVDYIIGVARPDNIATWNRYKKMLGYRVPTSRGIHNSNTIKAVYEIVLPNWQEKDCPWCHETELYEKVLNKAVYLDSLPSKDYKNVDVLKKLRERYESLTKSRSRGMFEELFLIPNGYSQMTLKRDSLFAPPSATQAEVFTGIASAVQNLRTNSETGKQALLGKKYPIAAVLNADEYVHDVYTDSILRASILRSCKSNELTYTNYDSEDNRTNNIKIICQSSEQDVNDLQSEIVISILEKKCHVDFNFIKLTMADCELVSALLAHAIPKTVEMDQSSDDAADAQPF
jgi:hypothetical protein